jgi:hypothetical protein
MKETKKNILSEIKFKDSKKSKSFNYKKDKAERKENKHNTLREYV